ncbi:MAG TPA: SMC-Scp complex subunit ScpB [Pirellulales bacterium]|nr:SMC-Scp complex subunit ScpB [Pirellulales bacterium]
MTAKPTKPKADDSLGLAAVRPAAVDGGLSLDRLSAAFAEMLSAGDDPYQSVEEAPPEMDLAADLPAEPAEGSATDACPITPATILEAMLFVGSPGGNPLTSQQVARLMRGVRPDEIDGLVRQLNETYVARNCPYEVAAEGAGYRLRLRVEYSRLRDRFYGKARQARLSQAAIEVLAIVAYNESLTAQEISSLRGTPCGPILSQLVRRQLLALSRGGKRSTPARYSTTPRFLELFSLESLEDLPRSPDVDRR